jgi:hypothetical protein
MVRIPEGIRRQLVRDAKKNGRSMNTEIIHRLAQSLVSAALKEQYEGYAEIAAQKAAGEAAKKVIEELRSGIRQDQIDKGSLLGNLRTPIIDALLGHSGGSSEDEGGKP